VHRSRASSTNGDGRAQDGAGQAVRFAVAVATRTSASMGAAVAYLGFLAGPA
jgi:hypothetical protein